MADERKPEFAFQPTARTYDELNLQYELIVCSVNNGRLVGSRSG
jgi:hypothetical protein